MRYLLDLETLLLVLKSQKQNCTLSADLKRFPGIAYKGPCHARVTQIGGKVISCLVQDSQGNMLIDENTALRELKKMGQIDWACSITSSQNTSLTSVLALVPRRAIPLERIDKNVLPSRYWQVLLLVDGSSTVAQIANALTLSSPSDVQELIIILKSLKQQGILIAIDNI